jgi:hypothetical protein
MIGIGDSNQNTDKRSVEKKFEREFPHLHSALTIKIKLYEEELS